MKAIDKKLIFMEQVLMQKHVADIKARMQQFVQIACAGQANPMMHMEMMQMAAQVNQIRQRCAHVWQTEYTQMVDSEGLLSHTEEHFCIICEAAQNTA